MPNYARVKIEDLRREMVQCAELKGLTDPEVINISKKIDALHNYLIRCNHVIKKQ